ncbi:hypothetical protein KR026_011783, partial [Drosophila bipectinata]
VSDDNAAASTVLEAKYSYCYTVYSRCIAQLREKIASQSTQAPVNVHTPAPTGCRFAAWQSLTDRFENRRLLVNSQLKILFNIQAISQESGVALKELQATIQSCLTALEMSAINVEAWDCLLVFMISSKLPKVTLSMWEQSVHNKAEIPTWKEFDNFLTERHRTLEAIDDVRPSGSVQFPPRSGLPTTP